MITIENVPGVWRNGRTDTERTADGLNVCKRVYVCSSGKVSMCVKEKAETRGHGEETEHPYVAIVMVTLEMV